ncbi:MAG: hypothetical protein WCR52_07330 [Bacteroidota bacterium]
MRYILFFLIIITFSTNVESQIDSVSCFYDLNGDLYKVRCLKGDSILYSRYWAKDKLSSFVLQNDKYDFGALQEEIAREIHRALPELKSELQCEYRRFMYSVVFIQGRYLESCIIKSDFYWDSNLKIRSVIDDFFKQHEVSVMLNVCGEMVYFEYVYCTDVRKSD